MGYQIGNHCYATKEQAENVYFSLVVPTIQTTQSATTVTRPYPLPNTTIPAGTAKIVAPEYRNGKWYLQNSVIEANLPQCDSVQNFKQGQEIGWFVFGLMAAMYAFVLLKRLLR